MSNDTPVKAKKTRKAAEGPRKVFFLYTIDEEGKLNVICATRNAVKMMNAQAENAGAILTSIEVV